jgi:hypothetical protein
MEQDRAVLDRAGCGAVLDGARAGAPVLAAGAYVRNAAP